MQGNHDVWLLDGSRMSRLTFDAAVDTRPIWSPDGDADRVPFESRTGPGDLYVKRANGAGPEEQLLTSDQVKNPMSWSKDGRFLLYRNNDPQTGDDLWVVPMVGDRTPSVVLEDADPRGPRHVFARRPMGGLPVGRIGEAANIRATVCPARRDGHCGRRPGAGVHGRRHQSGLAT